jgi:biopolymer transport protein TolQ
VVDSSVLSYFLNAGFVVKVVMLLLLIASLTSWTIIFQRFFFFRKLRRITRDFEKVFWQSNDLTKMYTEFNQYHTELQGVELIFHAGFREFTRLRKQAGIAPEAILEGAQRSMRIAHAHEQEELDQHLSFLATVGSISPYVGLFGTVWGIMTSFHDISQSQSATIAMVAPGISEALVATAIGLFAAIPAVIAYNRFANHAERLSNQYATFMEEFSNILYRQLYGSMKHEL